MSKNTYMWISIVLAVVVIGLVVYIATRPKPVDTVALQHDLSDFSAELTAWNAQYGANPSTSSQQQLSSALGTFQQKISADSGR